MTPDGREIWINERQTDLYGYGEHAGEANDPRLRLAVPWVTGDMQTDRAFFTSLGAVQLDADWLQLAGGRIWLTPDAGAGQELRLLTTRPLADAQARAAALGFQVTCTSQRVSIALGAGLTVTVQPPFPLQDHHPAPPA